MAKEDDDAIAIVKAGGRCKTRSTLSGFTADPKTCFHRWRTVACNSDQDVCECSECGKQIVCACDFDEEYA